MKNSAWYTKLWQSKMQELPLQGDEHAAWEKMQGLLEQHLPVDPSVVKPGLSTSAKSKTPYLIMGATVITAIIVYLIIYFISINHPKKTNKPIIERIPKQVNEHVNNTQFNTSRNTPVGDRTYNNLPANKQDLINVATTTGKNQNGKNQDEAPKNNNIVKQNADNSTISKDQPLKQNKKYDTFNKYHADNNSTASNNNKPVNKRNNLHYQKPYNRLLTTNIHHRLNTKSGSKSKNTANDKHTLFSGGSLSTKSKVSPANKGTALNIDTANHPSIDSANDIAQSTKKNNQSTIKATITDGKTKDQSTAIKSNKKASPNKNSENSKFVINALFGISTNSNANINPFLGVNGNYNLNNKWAIIIGVNAPSTRIISGSYSKSNLNYITLGDSSKRITHNSGKLTISSTKRIVDIDIPVLISYQLSSKFTITGGPVISIPIRSGTSKNKLGPLSGSADTTTLRTVTPYVNSTTINTNINFGFSGGLQYNLNRFYWGVSYLQAVSPYTISSGLGSGKTYYHTIQLGVGYHIFIAKKKK